MEPFGYVLRGNSRTASPDFIPSLIGVDPQQVNPNRADPYFVRIELTDRTVTSLSRSRWVNYDSLPLAHRDPILEVKAPTCSYYIPASDLYAIAAANHDDDTIEMIVALGAQPR